MPEAFHLLIGSGGDDSHSVGMFLLEIAFRESGFFVKNIGIMNVLDDFFSRAENFDAIFISCMNGHADLYLQNFLLELKRFNLKKRYPKIWYLGGNLSVQESAESCLRRYLKMGFDFVSPKPISCDDLKKRLLKDFYNKGIKKRRVHHLTPDETIHIPSLDMIDDNPMPDEVFRLEREKVLDSWPTGQGVWNADIKKNHATAFKNMHNILLHSQPGNCQPLIQPRTGVAHTCDEIEILTFLRQKGLDISSIQLDAASREKMYDKAYEGVLRTEKGKQSFLNGYPVPVHGVTGTTRIMTKTPVEAHQIPSKEDNAQGLQLTHKGLLLAREENIDEKIVNQEMILLEKEVTAIISFIENLGNGSIARGAIRAFEKGILDIPFSPGIYNKNRLITARDCDGAIRFINPEQIPFDKDIIDFHKEKIHQRMTRQRALKIFEILETDLTRIWKDDYIRWPLDGHYAY